jgi:hypothetical protein
MKIVIMGGAGLIGSKTVAILRQGGRRRPATARRIIAGGTWSLCAIPALFAWK